MVIKNTLTLTFLPCGNLANIAKWLFYIVSLFLRKVTKFLNSRKLQTNLNVLTERNYASESPIKKMKNTFYVILKALFVL